MAIADVHVRDSLGNPVVGATVQVVGTVFCTGLEDGQIWGQSVTDSSGFARITMNDLWGVCGTSCVIVKASKGSAFAKTLPILTDSQCNVTAQNLVLGMPVGPGPHFEIQQLWVKKMLNGVLVQAWNMLEVGSPESGHSHTWPKIPEWTPEQGDWNLQIEATVKNLTSQTLNVRFRTQTCPRSTSGLPPMPIPPCGDLVDSGASVSIAPGAVVTLPIWLLRMWSENIDEHNEIVDVNQQVYNSVVRYWDNLEYRADDWYTPVDVGVSGGFGITVHVQDQQGSAVQSANVNLT